jgi:small-conductance mechanosensitive channel
MNDEIESLLSAFWHDLERPDVWWQFAVLLLCLAAALSIERFVRTRSATLADVTHFSEGGVRRLAFPLSGLLLVMVGRAVLHYWHPVNLLSIAIPLLGSLAAIRMVFFVLRRNFTTSTWLANFERGFALLVWGGVALHITGLLPQLIAFLEEVSFPVGKQQINLWLLIQGIATLIIALLIALWLGDLVESRLARAEGMDRNLRVVFSRIAKAVLVLLAILIGLPLLGIDLTTLSVFGGALGVGLGLGLQKIASNYVSGFIILLDRSIRIGNVIAVGSDRGQVTKITTRYTVLSSVTGIEALVPNEVLVGSVVLNESYSDRQVRVPMRVQVAYSSDLERAMVILAEAARSQPRVLADPPPKAFVVEFADSGITLELGFWIRDPEDGSLSLRSEINLAIWREFKAAGIEIPSPQREVRLLGPTHL